MKNNSFLKLSVAVQQAKNTQQVCVETWEKP